MPNSETTRKDQSRRLNHPIDRALEDPSEGHFRKVLRLAATRNTEAMAERVRHHATIRARLNRLWSKRILRSRDKLITAIYRAAVPEGWFCGWCDGSSIERSNGRIAGIGGMVFDDSGHCITQFSTTMPSLDAFEAEITALTTLMQTALAHGARRFRAHTDCDALVDLWNEHRRDPRLVRLAGVARDFSTMELYLLPRQHNQLAHRLAKAAALGVQPESAA